MRDTLRLLFAFVFGLGTACAAGPRVQLDERVDFSSYHTWAWHPETAGQVDAPEAESPTLSLRLAGLIERELTARGYTRAAGRADFFVSYQLVLRRQEIAVEVPRAPYLLSSHSYSASYWIEGSETKYRIYQDLQLLVRAGDRDGRISWQAMLEHRSEEGFEQPLEDMVTRLLESFPQHRGAEPGRKPRQRGSSGRMARAEGAPPAARTREPTPAEASEPLPGLLPSRGGSLGDRTGSSNASANASGRIANGRIANERPEGCSSDPFCVWPEA